MKKNIIPIPPRGTIALPQRGTRPQTAVDRIKAKLDPDLMCRVAGVLVEPGRATIKKGGR